MWSPIFSSRSLAVRGIAALIFGIVVFFLPTQILLGLVALFGAYALVSGVVALVSGLRKEVEGRGWLFLEAAAGILIGLLTLSRPEVTVLGLTYLIGAWAIITGILQIAEAFTLRRYIHREWLYLISGVITVLLGFLIMARPFAGAVTITYMLGMYGILYGISSLMASRRVRKVENTFAQEQKSQERRRAA